MPAPSDLSPDPQFVAQYLHQLADDIEHALVPSPEALPLPLFVSVFYSRYPAPSFDVCFCLHSDRLFSIICRRPIEIETSLSPQGVGELSRSTRP